uniref:Uncharacterized protein n=1 Tax=Timema shepardi TaxID=629360 RepID=A0A7R9B1T4_TIMSH|nr:unnamed protein product [Timema shepardi]
MFINKKTLTKSVTVCPIKDTYLKDMLPEELMFLETSAKTGENVEEAFLKCSKTILAKIETGELDPERIGSGIQYGDTSTRRLHRESNRRQPDCICRM